MKYAEFRDHFEAALRAEGLFFDGAARRVETIDLENTVRHWKVYVHRPTPATAEPFHVSAAIEFDWSPVDTARAFTCEEDLLTELMGRRARLPRTERRWTRVDLSLDATCRLKYSAAADATPVNSRNAERAKNERNPGEVREKSRRRAGRQNGCRPAQRSSLPTTAATMSTGAQIRSRIMPLTGWSIRKRQMVGRANGSRLFAG